MLNAYMQKMSFTKPTRNSSNPTTPSSEHSQGIQYVIINISLINRQSDGKYALTLIYWNYFSYTLPTWRTGDRDKLGVVYFSKTLYAPLGLSDRTYFKTSGTFKDWVGTRGQSQHCRTQIWRLIWTPSQLGIRDVPFKNSRTWIWTGLKRN